MNLDKFKKFSRGQEKIDIVVNREVWVYSRISSKDQQANRSIDNQKDEANKYAKSNNYIITRSFGETFESASGDFTRKEFSKLISAVRLLKKRPFAILIYTMSRFSRSGGGGISLAQELIDDLGVNLIEVATGKNTCTAEGKLEIYTGLIRAKQDNIDRLKVTIPGMKKHLEKGNCLGRPPIGYVIYGPRVKNHKYFSPIQKIEKSELASKIRIALDLKLQGL